MTTTILGLMSGTSADGLDIACCEVASVSDITLVESQSFSYPSKLREAIRAAQTLTAFDDPELEARVTQFVIDSIDAFIDNKQLDRQSISCVANHGQTILHQPNAAEPFSLQIGNAQHMADALRLTVVSDFRTADIAVGGQGAPLIPAFHEAVFQQYAPCNIINIGGIANITSLEPHSKTAKVLGFDTGPGNTLLDNWNKLHNQTAYDANGDWAKSGTCHPALLNALLDEAYLSAPYPKSTGQDLFNQHWLDTKLASIDDYESIKPQDIQNTLSQLTATSIAQAIEALGQSTRPIYLCGGGVHNGYLVEQLQTALPLATISSTADIGIDPNWVEAIGFAWLGHCKLNNITGNIPEVTGANSKVCLGVISRP